MIFINFLIFSAYSLQNSNESDACAGLSDKYAPYIINAYLSDKEAYSDTKSVGYLNIVNESVCCITNLASFVYVYLDQNKNVCLLYANEKSPILKTKITLTNESSRYSIKGSGCAGYTFLFKNPYGIRYA